jgi:hypothetical protein
MIDSPAKSKPRGAALMAVLWLIAILSLACMATLRVISFDMEIASAKIHGSSARQLAEMGIAIGTNQAVKPSDPLLHRVNEETGEGFDVTVEPDSLHSINAILLKNDKDHLVTIFCSWGLEPDVAAKIVDALTDWVDADDDESLNGAEKKFYEGEGRINQPFNRPFYNIDEMALVRGMDLVEAVRPDWRKHFTVWGNVALDVNSASAEIIAEAAGVPPKDAEFIPERVKGPDGQLHTEDDTPYQPGEIQGLLSQLGVDPNRQDILNRFTAIDPNSPTGAGTTRIESIGFTEGAKYKITVIVQNRSANPIKLLERTEEIIP